MEIRVKKICLDGSTKRLLKQWGIQIKRDRTLRQTQVRILIFPDNMYLIKGTTGIYFIVTIFGRCLGHIYSPYELDGGLLTFAP